MQPKFFYLHRGPGGSSKDPETLGNGDGKDDEIIWSDDHDNPSGPGRHRR